MKRYLVVFAAMAMFATTVAVSATSTAPREFAPVQKGPVTAGETVVPYAPDRILVQFKESSLTSSLMNVGPQLGATVPGAITGLASVDALNREVGARKISRPFIEPKDKFEAARLGIDRCFMIEVAAGSDIPRIVERYAADPNIEHASPDGLAFPAGVPTDPLYPNHWGHNNTGQLPRWNCGGWGHTGPPVGTPGFDAHAEEAWDLTCGSWNVIIAIIDTGVDLDHPDLNLTAGWDFGDGDSNPDDDSAIAGHGTACAGVAASLVNNGLGACGIAPACRVMPLKVANSAGTMYWSAIANAIMYAADHDADVASMSFGAYGGSDFGTDLALAYAHNAGVSLLAATANDNHNYISYPATNPYVIAVGAASPCGDRKRSSSNPSDLNPGVSPDPNGYTCDGECWWGSNYGVDTQDAAGAVDILGPTIVPTTDIAGGGGYQPGDYEPYFNGTSCATPYAAGVCGLIKTQFPSWTPDEIRDRLVNTATDIVNVESGFGWDRYSGYGMVNAAAAAAPIPPGPIMASRIDASGNVAWTKTVNDGNYAVLADGNSPQIVSDGSGGAIISWNHKAAYAFGENYYQIWAQRIDSDGNPVWVGDRRVSMVYPADADHAVVSDGVGGAIYTFGSKDPSPPAQVNKWLWVQRLDAAGTRLWADVLIADITLYDKQFNATSDGAGGVIAAWTDARLSGNRDIYGQKVDADGNEKWTDGGLSICTVSGHQGVPAVAPDGNDGTFIAWGDARSDEGDIYAQRIDNNCPVHVSNVNITTTFDPSDYTWDAEVTFETNVPADAVVAYDPTMDCFPACAYSQQASGPEATTHAITLTDLAASTSYCYQITADPSGCQPQVTGSFTLDNSYDEIYDVVATFNPLECEISVTWKTQFPSKQNRLHWRPMGQGGWNVQGATPGNCAASRSYTSAFAVSPAMYYEYKVSTEIDGAPYETGVKKKKTIWCIASPASGRDFAANRDLTKPFVVARPNPFNPQTTVSFNVPAPADVDLKIYSASGGYVTTLASGPYSAGIHHVEWDARDDRGGSVASGVYFARLTVGDIALTSKLLLLK